MLEYLRLKFILMSNPNEPLCIEPSTSQHGTILTQLVKILDSLVKYEDNYKSLDQEVLFID